MTRTNANGIAVAVIDRGKFTMSALTASVTIREIR
jgi:hypothetical protein